MSNFKRVARASLVGVLAVCCIHSSLSAAAETPAKSDSAATEVISFQPGNPAGKVRKGHCWTESIAVQRSTAWRCMVGNEIYDPCFQIPGLKGSVVCDADPASAKAGFRLKLTKPLPKRSESEGESRPWMLQLADGTVCTIMTGTTPFVNNEALPYGCEIKSEHPVKEEDQNVWTSLSETIDHSGPVWMVKEVTYQSGKDDLQVLSSKSIAVKRVWQ